MSIKAVYNDDGTVTIDRSDFENLVQAWDDLDRLEVYGVDNWIGYSDALNDTEGYFKDEA